MKLLRAVRAGTFIWIAGVSLYSLSFYVPLLEDVEQQSNMLLFLVVMPLVWFGAKLYYKGDNDTHGFWLGLVFFLTSAALDALITVPLLIIPNGGTHYSFFTDIGFWIIGLEFIATAVLYWNTKGYVNKEISN